MCILGYKQTKEHKQKIRKAHLGETNSKEARRKISEALKGRKFSQEWRQKLSEASRGERNPNYGKHRLHTEKTKRKMSKSHFGKVLSEETKRKVREANLGKKVSRETCKKISKAKLGIKIGPFSEETKRKMKKYHLNRPEKHRQSLSKAFSGENNPNWLGGISFEPYGKDWTKRLRKQIRERDNYICQLCGKINSKHVHHIDYDKKNCNPKNLINLCMSCNIKINANREYWTNFINQLIGG